MNIGGAERSLIGMLENFDYEKYEVDLFLYRHEGEFMKFIPKDVNLLPTVKQYTTFERPIKDIIKEGHILLGMARLLAKVKSNVNVKLFKREWSTYKYMQYIWNYSIKFLPKIDKNYDLAIGFLGPYDFIIDKVKANIKMGWIHSDYKTAMKSDIRLDEKMWNELDYIVNVSEDCEKSFLQVFPQYKSKCIVLENILSTEFIKNESKEEISNQISDDTEINICTVGRFCEAKGFDLAIEACRKLIDKGIDVKWYVIGYGDEENKIKNLITKFNLEERFILLGKKINPYPYIQKCDIYCQPSRYEGKSVTVREAQILCKPVVITRYPTANSQVEHNIDGYITDLSVNGIVNGIERVYKDLELREFIVKNCSKRDYSNYKELNKIYDILST